MKGVSWMSDMNVEGEDRIEAHGESELSWVETGRCR